MARGKRPPAWSEEEHKLLRQWIAENPRMASGEIGRTLEGTIKRTSLAIALRADELRKSMGLPSPYGRVTVPKVETEKPEPRRETLVEKLNRMAGELEGRAQVLREMATEIGAIEAWARDTLAIRKQLFGYEVDTASGLVEKVHRTR